MWKNLLPFLLTFLVHQLSYALTPETPQENKLVKEEKSQEKEEKKTEKVFACVRDHTANVRQEPTSGSRLVTVLERYWPVKVLERNEKWIKVQSKERSVGWVFATLIDEGSRCVQVTATQHLSKNQCPKPEKLNRDEILVGEGFKVLEVDIGCNKVMDRYQNIFWIESYHIWPKSDNQKMIILDPIGS